MSTRIVNEQSALFIGVIFVSIALFLLALGGCASTPPGPGPGTPDEMRNRMFAHPERIPPGEKTPEQLAESRKSAHYYHNSVGLDEALVARLGEIECQTLILQGTKDGMMPPESGQLLMREIPHAKLLYVYDAGHNIEVDQPQRFVSLIRDFLSRGEAFIVNPGDALAGVQPDVA